ncbi:MAG: aminoacyl-tRNA hydrolase [Ruminococcaceae bacterium]|nr:aminoacyl-tRNA hydrolase [Oscillospiraceae bacterium]
MFFRKSTDNDRWIIVGLGNIGSQYDNTRHNCGFAVVDILASEYGIDVSKKKFQGTIGEGKIQGEKVVLVKPSTYMNLSGECVSKVMNWYKATLDKLIIIYDDIDIETGAVRVRAKGRAGSHRGMKSVIEHLGTTDFPRVRLGIGKQPSFMDLAQYVIGYFTTEELEKIIEGRKKASEAVVSIITKGCDFTMNKFNCGEK